MWPGTGRPKFSPTPLSHEASHSLTAERLTRFVVRLQWSKGATMDSLEEGRDKNVINKITEQ